MNRYKYIQLKLVGFGLCLFFQIFASSESEVAFTNIYKNKVWGANEHGEGYSGGGSTAVETRGYRKFLQDFLKAYDIKSVVDAGCGDWTFSQMMNWEGVEYLGVDVVKSVIEKDAILFGKKSVRFLHVDFLNTDLPSADLLLCKDVLQHLPNSSIFNFAKQFKKFRYCLITNDIDLYAKHKNNIDISFGQWRAVDLTASPFFLKGQKIFTYCGVPGVQAKQVLLIKN